MQWEERSSIRRERHPRSSREGCAGWDSLQGSALGSWAGKNKAGTESEKCGRLLTEKYRTEGKNIAELQVGKRLLREEGTAGPWAEEGGRGCKSQRGKFGIDPWRNALGRREAQGDVGVGTIQAQGILGSGLC